MQKPTGWDTTQAQNIGEFKRLPPGGYICQIVGAKVGTSKAGREQMVLALDIETGCSENAEEYRGYFKSLFDDRRSSNADAKWPCNYYQGTEGESLKFFKGLMQLIEKSNPGYKWDFNEAGLKGKYIGMVFREEEYLGNDGKPHTNCKPAYPKTTEDIMAGRFSVPEKKTLDSQVVGAQKWQGTSGGMGGTWSSADEDPIPF